MRKHGHLVLVESRRRQRPCRDVRFARPRTGHRPVPTPDYGFSHGLTSFVERKGAWSAMLGVESLSQVDCSEVADVLADSFQLDPAFVELFREVPPRRARSYHAFMHIWARSSFRLGHSVQGIRVNGALVGVAGVTAESKREVLAFWPELLSLPVLLAEMKLPVGLALASAVRRPPAIPSATPEISMLAVRPSMHGQGIGATLLRAAHSITAKRRDADYVYLYTTATKSKAFYEKQGYQLVAATRGAAVDVFHMLGKLQP